MTAIEPVPITRELVEMERMVQASLEAMVRLTGLTGAISSSPQESLTIEDLRRCRRILEAQDCLIPRGATDFACAADYYEALFPMPAKRERVHSALKLPMLSLKAGGTTDDQCLDELRAKLSQLGLTPEDMAAGKRYT